MQKTKTPELDKIQKYKEHSQKIGEFMEWLSSERNFVLAQRWPIEELDEEDDFGDLEEVLLPIQIHKEKLLAEFFGVDLDKAEEERRALLDELRSNAD